MAQRKVLREDADAEGKILDAALVAFAERGFHGTSIPDLLGAAKVGASSFYRRFASKEALVNAVFRREKGALQHALEDGLDRLQPAEALFADFWARLVTYSRRSPASFRFLEMQDHVPYLDGESRARELAVLGPIYVACLDFQQRGVWHKTIRPEVAIALVWGAFVGLCKAERLGYFQLTPAMFHDARDACWRALATKETAHATDDHAASQRASRPAAHARKSRRARH